MADVIKYRFILRRATAAAATASNSVLLDGEFGLETDTKRLKIGDGVTVWNSLAYFTTGESFAIAAGSANVITATFTPPPILTNGQQFKVRAGFANTTTTPTFNPNALGALAVTKLGGVALVAADIARAGHELILRYVAATTSPVAAARYELLNPAAVGGVVSVVAGTNVTVDNTDPKNPIVSASGGSGGGHTPGPGTDPYIANVISLIPLDARSNTTGFYDFCENVIIDMNGVYGDKANLQYGKNTMRNTTAGLTVFSNGATPPISSSGALINTQDFCWEIDVKTSGTLAAFSTIVGNRPTNSATTGTVCVGINGSGQLYVYGNSAFIVSPTSATQVTNPGTVFNKIAYDVYSGVGSLYLNGVKIGSGAQATLNYTAKCSIGADYNATEVLPGNFANFRFTLGVSRYKSVAYTPLTTPYPFS